MENGKIGGVVGKLAGSGITGEELIAIGNIMNGIKELEGLMAQGKARSDEAAEIGRKAEECRARLAGMGWDGKAGMAVCPVSPVAPVPPAAPVAGGAPEPSPAPGACGVPFGRRPAKEKQGEIVRAADSLVKGGKGRFCQKEVIDRLQDSGTWPRVVDGCGNEVGRQKYRSQVSSVFDRDGLFTHKGCGNARCKGDRRIHRWWRLTSKGARVAEGLAGSPLAAPVAVVAPVAGRWVKVGGGRRRLSVKGWSMGRRATEIIRYAVHNGMDGVGGFNIREVHRALVAAGRLPIPGRDSLPGVNRGLFESSQEGCTWDTVCRHGRRMGWFEPCGRGRARVTDKGRAMAMVGVMA